MSDELVRYRPDKVNDFKPHSDGTGSFSSFLISNQARKPATRAAFDIVAIAKATAPTGTGEYANRFAVDQGAEIMFKPKTGKRHPRAIAVVHNDSDHAVPMEFGSGKGSAGKSKAEGRPQGGSNQVFRVLGRAGGKIGDWHE